MDSRKPYVAFVILSHKNPEQINLLAEALHKIYNCRVFLHVDKKSASIRGKIDTDLLTLIPEEKSISVTWGTYSQCEATLALIEAALSAGEKFDYVWLISGQDLPIMGSEKAAALLPAEPTPFIAVRDSSHPRFQWFSKRNDIAYPKCLMYRTLLSKIGRKALQFATGGIMHTWSVFRRKLGIPYYFGSSWWCLPYDCLREMMDIMESNPKVAAYFLRALNPDESMFQTLFMQTAYAGKQKGIMTYIDWSQGGASPRTLTLAQWDDLAAASKKYAFARKFDFSVDEAVCHRVIKELCGID